MRFYVPQISKTNPIINGEAHTHAAYALRIRVGDIIDVFDGCGNEYRCRVKDIKKDKTSLEILSASQGARECRIDVTLYLAVIKQDKFELTVQKATELGVTKIVPVYSMLAQRNFRLNKDRLNKIAISACEQCGRSKLPIIEDAIEFDQLLNRTENSYLIFPWERETIGNIKASLDKTQTEISLFIGPEGGITEEEKNKLVAVGARSVSLGARILRAETAAIAALSVLYYEMGEWNN